MSPSVLERLTTMKHLESSPKMWIALTLLLLSSNRSVMSSNIYNERAGALASFLKDQKGASRNTVKNLD